MREAELFSLGYQYADSIGCRPNIFLTIRWDMATPGGQPFERQQVVLARLRKGLKPGTPFICFWVLERDRLGASLEHSHIAFHLPVGCTGSLTQSIRRWVKADIPEAVKVMPCGEREGFDAKSLVTGYFLKGGNPHVRDRFLTPWQRRAWSAYQGEILGKRTGVSHAVSRGARQMKFLAETLRQRPIDQPANKEDLLSNPET